MVVVTQMGFPNFIRDKSFGSRLVIYPNPADNEITIDCKENALLFVFTQTGQNVAGFELIDSVNKLDISFLEPGFYFFQFQIGNKTVLKKLIKK